MATETRSWWKIAILLVIGINAVGFLAGQVAGSGYGNPWFDGLRQPSFMPPGWLFGTAWTILYTLLGIAAAMIHSLAPSKERRDALTVFWIQMVLNFTWSPIFFGAHDMNLGRIILIVLVLLSARAEGKFYRLKPLAGVLMIPYLGWLIFATVLNNAFIDLNPGASASLL
jgi:tryptophan-rich sensory protein